MHEAKLTQVLEDVPKSRLADCLPNASNFSLSEGKSIRCCRHAQVRSDKSGKDQAQGSSGKVPCPLWALSQKCHSTRK